jgi:hypothetical protein
MPPAAASIVISLEPNCLAMYLRPDEPLRFKLEA